MSTYTPLACCLADAVAAETSCRIVECRGCGSESPECHMEKEDGSYFCHPCCNVPCAVCSGAPQVVEIAIPAEVR